MTNSMLFIPCSLFSNIWYRQTDNLELSPNTFSLRDFWNYFAVLHDMCPLDLLFFWVFIGYAFLVINQLWNCRQVVNVAHCLTSISNLISNFLRSFKFCSCSTTFHFPRWSSEITFHVFCLLIRFMVFPISCRDTTLQPTLHEVHPLSACNIQRFKLWCLFYVRS